MSDDAALDIEKSLRAVRVASHSLRLDGPTKEAMAAIILFGQAVVDYARVRDAGSRRDRDEIERLKQQLADMRRWFMGETGTQDTEEDEMP